MPNAQSRPIGSRAMVVAQTFQLPVDQLCVWGPFFKRSIVIKEFSGDSSHVPSAGWPGWSSGPVPGKGPKGKSCQPHLLLVICQPLFHCYHSNLTHSWKWLSQLFETSFMIWSSACDALLKLIVFTGVLINVFMLIIWCVIIYIYICVCASYYFIWCYNYHCCCH